MASRMAEAASLVAKRARLAVGAVWDVCGAWIALRLLLPNAQVGMWRGAQNEKQSGKLLVSKTFVNFAYTKCISHEQALKYDFIKAEIL